MVCRSTVAKGFNFTFCPDDLPPAADRLRSIMRGRFVDELTEEGMKSTLSIASTTEQLIARVAQGGIAGLAGNPFRRFPGLVGNSVNIDMTVSAHRYKSRTFSQSLGPFNVGLGFPADYPDFFSPIDLGDVGLHREVTRLKGRCVQNAAVQRLALAGVSVEVIGLWHQFPASNVDPPTVVENPLILALRQGLYADRSIANHSVSHCQMLPLAGGEKTLLKAALEGDTRLRISDRQNLFVNDVLAIEADHPDLVEYIRVANIEGAGTPEQAATVSLAYPLKKNHREGVTCLRHNVNIPGGTAVNNFTRDAQDKDQTLFLDALTDIDESTVEISGGAEVPEYHAVNLYQTLSDAQGYFRLPPLHRIAQLELRASRADLPAPVNLVLSPEYDQVENRFDLIFS